MDILFLVLTLLLWAWPALKFLLIVAIGLLVPFVFALAFGLQDPPGH